MFSRSALLISLFLLLGIIGAVFLLSGAKLGAPQLDTTQTVFFTSTRCEDCQNTENLLQQRQIQFKQKAVETPLVQAELQQVLTHCRLSQNQRIQVPLLFINSTCLSGSTAISDYLSQQ